MKPKLFLTGICLLYLFINIATSKKDLPIECDSSSDARIFLKLSSNKYLNHFVRRMDNRNHELIVTFTDSAGVNTSYIADSLCKIISEPCVRNNGMFIVFRDTSTNKQPWTPEYGHVFYSQNCQ
jgi:hypothetical protein